MQSVVTLILKPKSSKILILEFIEVKGSSSDSTKSYTDFVKKMINLEFVGSTIISHLK